MREGTRSVSMASSCARPPRAPRSSIRRSLARSGSSPRTSAMNPLGVLAADKRLDGVTEWEGGGERDIDDGVDQHDLYRASSSSRISSCLRYASR